MKMEYLAKLTQIPHRIRTLSRLARGRSQRSASPRRDYRLERLQSLLTSTTRRVSLLAAVVEFADASGKLNGPALGDVVEGYLKTVASVKRTDVSEAVEEFIAQENR